MDPATVIRLFAVLCFVIGAWSDLRTRSAPNRLWLALLGLGLIALAIDVRTLALGELLEVVVGTGLVVAIVATLAFLSWRAGYLGGADAKAIMVLPLAFPRLPGEGVVPDLLTTVVHGFEVLAVVWVGIGLAGLWWTFRPDEERGVPFLVPMLAGVVLVVAVGLSPTW